MISLIESIIKFLTKIVECLKAKVEYFTTRQKVKLKEKQNKNGKRKTSR